MRYSLIIFLVLSFNISKIFCQKKIYVSANGLDSNNGTESSPLKTIQKAFDLSQNFSSEKTEIILKEGIYRPNSTIILESKNLRTEETPLILKSEQPHIAIISGSRKITGWEKLENEIYVADAKGLKFRQLYVNGKKAIKARYPDENKYHKHVILGCELPSPGIIVKDDLREIIDLSKSELVLRLRWAGVRMPLSTNNSYIEKDVNDEKKVWGHYINVENKDALKAFFKSTKRCKFWNQHPIAWFEGKKEFLNLENEWYLDTIQNKVYYKPAKEINLSQSTVEVPILTNILNLNETQNISIENIIFENSDWQLPHQFYFAAQATMNQIQNHSHFDSPSKKTTVKWGDVLPPSAIELENCKNITIKNNVIRNTGGGGLSLRYGEENIKIIGNVIHTTGGNGISGGVSPKYKAKDLPIAKNILISNNYIANIGTETFGTCGIGFYFADNLRIINNEFYALGYQAIHTGWNNLYNIGRLKNVYIKNNNIHNFLYINNDGGAIHNVNFVLGDFIIEGNHIHHAADMSFRRNGKALGVYLDNCTTNAKVLRNIAKDYIIGDLNGTTTPRYKNYYLQNKKGLGVSVPYFEGNHTTFKHRKNVLNTISEEEQKRIKNNAGVKPEFQYMRKFAPKSSVWENSKKGNRLD